MQRLQPLLIVVLVLVVMVPTIHGVNLNVNGTIVEPRFLVSLPEVQKGVKDLYDVKKSDLNSLFRMVVAFFFLAIFFILVIIGIVISGCRTFFENVFYMCLCRHCLKCIIKIRKRQKKEKKDDGSADKPQKIDLQMMDKKILLKLNEELRQQCLDDDCIQNDEERIVYAGSKFQMTKVIKIIHERKQTTPWKKYKMDFKKAFGTHEELTRKTAIELWQAKQNQEPRDDEENSEFAQSSIGKQDFFLSGLTSQVGRTQHLKKLKEMLDIKCVHHQDKPRKITKIIEEDGVKLPPSNLGTGKKKNRIASFDIQLSSAVNNELDGSSEMTLLQSKSKI